MNLFIIWNTIVEQPSTLARSGIWRTRVFSAIRHFPFQASRVPQFNAAAVDCKTEKFRRGSFSLPAICYLDHRLTAVYTHQCDWIRGRVVRSSIRSSNVSLIRAFWFFSSEKVFDRKLEGQRWCPSLFDIDGEQSVHRSFRCTVGGSDTARYWVCQSRNNNLTCRDTDWIRGDGI